MLLNTKGTGINFINKERISGYLCMVTSSHGCNIHTLYMDYWQGLHIKQRSCLLSEKDFSDCVICIWRLSMYGAFALEYARANFYLRCQTFQVNLAMLNNLTMPGPQVTPSWVKQERAWLTVLKKSVGTRYNFNPLGFWTAWLPKMLRHLSRYNFNPLGFWTAWLPQMLRH